MTRDVISPKIFQLIMSNQKVKSEYRNEQSVRNAISLIHKKNEGITMNAAAHQFARRNDFSVWRYLSQEDRLSLRYLKSLVSAPAQLGERRIQRVRVKDIKPDFENPFIKEANENARVYPYVYILENSLRRIIFEKIGTSQDWWDNKRIVSEEIQNYAKRI